MEASSRIAPEVYRDLRQEFARFAASCFHSAFFIRLLERAQPPAELAEDEVVCSEPVLLKEFATLAKALGQGSAEPVRVGMGGMRLALASPVDELWSFASRLLPEPRRALDVLLRRALDPVEALSTWPAEALFSPEEVALLKKAHREQAEVETPRGSWAPGRDVDYHGYACVIVKFTRLCNLRCTYCHDWREGPNQTMRFPVQVELFRKLLGAPSHSRIDVFWHGGEPTLLGRRGFLKVLALQRWFLRPGQYIRNILQTNATTMDSAWTRFLSRYRFELGVSLDGPEEVHDASRPQAGGRPSFRRVRQGIRAVQESGLRHSVLMVIGPAQQAYGAEPLVRFLQEEGITNVSLLPVRPTAGPERPGEAYLTHADFTSFLLEVNRARKARPKPWIQVRELDTALRAIRGESPRFCELFGNCVGSYFSIEPDGAVGHCDKYVGDPAFTIGNLRVQDFDEIRRSERVRQMVEENRQATARQEPCPYFRYCRGWCPYERYMADRQAPDRDSGCCGLSGLFEALQQEVRDGHG